MPRTSVVLSSYQHARFLRRAVESALTQTDGDLEIVAVDDGSTDGSQGILEELAAKDGRLRCLFHDRNEGIAKTFNDGLSIARGQYVGFLASDDAWAPHKLAVQVPLLGEHPSRVVVADAILCDADLRPSRLRLSENPWAGVREVLEAMPGDEAVEEPEVPEQSGFEVREVPGLEVVRRMTSGSLLCLSTFLLQREQAVEVGFDEGLRYANDFKLITELARRLDFLFIDAPLLRYRIHGENASLLLDRAGWHSDGNLMNAYVKNELLPLLSRPR